MAHPCTPCLGRAIPGIAQMLLACLPISAITMIRVVAKGAAGDGDEEGAGEEPEGFEEGG